MRIDVLTLFPEAVAPYLSSSIVGRAVEKGIVELHLLNFRDFAHDVHRTVDDRPFGGGPGMVLMCGPVVEAVEHIEGAVKEKHGSPLRILLTPQGERLSQNLVAEFASRPWILIVCGRYEGFDERIHQSIPFREISIGDYVLSGGEPAAMVLIDAIVRLLPGALNDADSAANESFVGGLLDCPHYTRPREFRGMVVPEVLLSGDHAKIAAWRKEQSLIRTRERRPDLLGSETAKE
jgi:tRNA (guanine37-N1)-methyltransferase